MYLHLISVLILVRKGADTAQMMTLRDDSQKDINRPRWFTPFGESNRLVEATLIARDENCRQTIVLPPDLLRLSKLSNCLASKFLLTLNQAVEEHSSDSLRFVMIPMTHVTSAILEDLARELLLRDAW